MSILQIKKPVEFHILKFNRLSGLFLLSHKDSNLDRQIQKLQCYHYTMRQFLVDHDPYSGSGSLFRVKITKII